jgi:hypothetical protein
MGELPGSANLETLEGGGRRFGKVRTNAPGASRYYHGARTGLKVISLTQKPLQREWAVKDSNLRPWD